MSLSTMSWRACWSASAARSVGVGAVAGESQDVERVAGGGGESGGEQGGESGVGVGGVDLDDGSGGGGVGVDDAYGEDGESVRFVGGGGLDDLAELFAGVCVGVGDVGEVDVVFGAQGEGVADALVVGEVDDLDGDAGVVGGGDVAGVVGAAGGR